MTNMMIERTPLAVLASALSEHGAHEQVPAVAQTSDWASLKNNKRKRTVACGRCDACCRDDCGACLNCLDKPKFGGSGTCSCAARASPQLTLPLRTAATAEGITVQTAWPSLCLAGGAQACAWRNEAQLEFYAVR